VVDFLWGESGLVHDFVWDFFVCGFWRGFCEIWAVNAVFWWTGRGELSGKDGLLKGVFWGLWILQFLGIYLGSGRFAPFRNAGSSPSASLGSE
jgi:hypothetical protein